MISAIVYDADTVEHYEIDDEADLEAARRAPGTTWVRVSSPTPTEERAISEAFGLHALELENVRNDVRPKTEAFEGHAFVLVKTVALERGETTFDEEIRTQPIGLFLGGGWLVTLADHAANLPELSQPYAYPTVMVGMVLVTGILLVHFRQEGWI